MGGVSLIGMALSAAAPIVSGIMQRNAAKAAAAQAREEAAARSRIAGQNRTLALNEAEATTRAGAKEEGKLRDRIHAALASQNAQYGAAGLSLSSGSPLDVAQSTLEEGEADATTLRENYARKKFSLVNQAQQYGTQGRYAMLDGENRARAYEAHGRAAMTGGLLQGAGFVASKWSDRLGAPRGGGIVGMRNNPGDSTDGNFYGYGSMARFNDERRLLKSREWYGDFRPKWRR